MRACATALAGLSAALLPRLAGACPMCASQQPGGVARIVALGLMILLPFSIAFVVFRALRRAEAGSEAPSDGRAATRASSERAGAMRESSP